MSNAEETKIPQFEQTREKLAGDIRTELDTLLSSSVESSLASGSILKQICKTLTNLYDMGSLIAVDKGQDLEVHATVSDDGVVKFKFKLVVPQPLSTTSFTITKPPDMSDETWEKFSRELAAELEKELTDNIVGMQDND